MAIVISISNQKGGVGKSTTAQALASSLTDKGKRVLVIDADPQSNLTYSSGVDQPELTLSDVLSGECRAEEALIKTDYYDLLASDFYLTNVGMMQDVNPLLLQEKLKHIRNRYNFVIIDTPPALGPLSFVALSASDYVIVPCQPRAYDLQGLGRLNQTIKTIQEKVKPDLRVLGILLIKFNNRTILNRDLKDMIEEYTEQMDTVLFKTTIRDSVVAAEAQTMREPLIKYASRSKVNQDYIDFTNEILKKLGGL